MDKQNSNTTYIGKFPNLSMDLLLSLIPLPINGETISLTRIFVGKYCAIPCVLTCVSSDGKKLLHASTITDYIRDELKHDLNLDRITETYDYGIERLSINSRIFDLNNGVIIEITGIYMTSGLDNPNQYKPDYSNDQFLVASVINFYFLPENRIYVQDLANRFSKMILTVTEAIPSKTFTLQMVCRNQYGYYLSSIEIKKPIITDLALHYGKQFVSIHEKIIKNLNTKEEKGIVFLHGIPGSGKTHYIRYLIHEIEDKTLIYIPPDMAKEISAPEFLPFLMQYPNSILIIEDAENIIKDRSETSIPSQAVANLLNLSDGLLGDAMHQQIIATFNCDLTTIDPALLRQGRLIANYEFNKLDLENSKILSEKLGFGIENISEPMTLAQIYNQNDKIKQENIISNEHELTAT